MHIDHYILLSLVGVLVDKGILTKEDVADMMSAAKTVAEAKAAEFHEAKIQRLMAITKCSREHAEEALR